MATEQPPLGGCVLKLKLAKNASDPAIQPPLGGCVLKHRFPNLFFRPHCSRL